MKKAVILFASMFALMFAFMAFALSVSWSAPAPAQTRVTLLAPDPLRQEVSEIVSKWEMKTGNTVQKSWGTGVGTRRTVAEQGALDVTLLFAPFERLNFAGGKSQRRMCAVMGYFLGRVDEPAHRFAFR